MNKIIIKHIFILVFFVFLFKSAVAFTKNENILIVCSLKEPDSNSILCLINGKIFPSSEIANIQNKSVADISIVTNKDFIKKYTSNVACKALICISLKSNNIKHNLKNVNDSSEEPLYFINSQEVSKDIMQVIDLAKIENIRMVTDKEIIKTYTNKDANKSIVLITLKKTAKNQHLSSKEYKDKNPSQTVLYILNGKEISKKVMESLDVEQIDKVEVIIDKDKIKNYTNKIVDGLILITSKKKAV